MKRIYIILTIAAVMLASCNKEYEGDRVFKQYLLSRTAEAEALVREAVVGDAEGEYRTGAPEALQAFVESAYAIYWDTKASQTAVDKCYEELARAVLDFEDNMHPFVSSMELLIAQSKDLLELQVGDGEGMIPTQADADMLQTAIEKAEQFMATVEDLTQRKLDIAYNELQLEMFALEGKIPGKVAISVDNPSFEQPGVDGRYDDFDAVPGWQNRGWLNNFTPWDGLVPNCVVNADQWWMAGKSVPEGQYVLHLANYCSSVWQLLNEGVHTNSRYTVSAKVARMSEWNHADTRFLIQLVVFTGTPGDFNKAVVLKEAEFDNMINVADFTEKSMIYDVPATSEYAGKRIAVCLRSYISKPWSSSSEDGFVWQDNGCVDVDCVEIFREKHEIQ